MDIALIQKNIREGDYHWRQHAIERSIERDIAEWEVSEAILNRSIIEEYPDDKYGPSCLILGFASNGKVIHVQCSHPSRSLIKIITVYEPDPNEWIDHEHRRG